MDQGTLLFDGQMLSLNEDSHQGPPQVARVTAFQRRVIPPRFHSSTEDVEMPGCDRTHTKCSDVVVQVGTE